MEVYGEDLESAAKHLGQGYLIRSWEKKKQKKNLDAKHCNLLIYSNLSATTTSHPKLQKSMGNALFLPPQFTQIYLLVGSANTT